MSYYDVRISMDAQNQAWTTVIGSVNLMCELLKGVSYSTLYEEPFWINNSTTCACAKLMLNATNLPDGLSEYFHFYNHERSHDSLGKQTPARVYASG
jgi:hypothetical protein